MVLECGKITGHSFPIPAGLTRFLDDCRSLGEIPQSLQVSEMVTGCEWGAGHRFPNSEELSDGCQMTGGH